MPRSPSVDSARERGGEIGGADTRSVAGRHASLRWEFSRRRDDGGVDHPSDLTSTAVHRGAEAAPASSDGWNASLALGFKRVTHRTVLVHRRHEGPLVVQKPLYPEGPDVCQCVVVHPPGGIVGGDRLALAVSVEAGARAQLTTPGASKWYRSSGPPATQTLELRIGEDAALEWLPQGTILYDGAFARNTVDVQIASGATFVSTDVVALGRRAAAQPFRCGEWRQRIDIVRDDAPIWSERSVVRADSALMTSCAGLNGASVFGTFVAVGPRLDDVSIAALRDVARVAKRAAVTRLPDILVGRYVGDSIEHAQRCLWTLWEIARPVLMGRPAVRPRIWCT